MCDKTIDLQIFQQCAEQVQQFKREAEILHEYLHRIIDCLRYMCSESIPHRGSDEKNIYLLAGKNETFQSGAGKFLNLVNSLGIYDKTVSAKCINLGSIINTDLENVQKEEGVKYHFCQIIHRRS